MSHFPNNSVTQKLTKQKIIKIVFKGVRVLMVGGWLFFKPPIRVFLLLFTIAEME